jgi:hypothetical protein
MLSKQKISYLEGSAYSLMVGFGETFFVALALSVGISAAQASLATTIPIVVASVLQLGLLRMLEHTSQKKSLILLSGLQAASLVVLVAPIFIFPQTQLGQWYIGTLLVFYWMFGQCASPVWNRFIANGFSPLVLRSFFFHRNTVCQISAIMALIVSALLLGDRRSFSDDSAVMIAVMIMIAAFFRFVSSFLFSFHPEPEHRPVMDREPSTALSFLFKPFVWPVIGLLFFTNFAVYISAPFFTAYKLQILHLSFEQFCLLVGVGFGARIFGTYTLNQYIERVGVKLLLIIGSLGIIPSVYFWVFSDNFYILIVFQVLAGIAWSCHEIGLALILVETVEEKARGRLLSWVTLISTLGMALGLAFAMFFVHAGQMPREDYHTLFTASTVARFIPLIFLPFIVDVQGREVFFRYLSLLTLGRGLQRPMIVPDMSVKRVFASSSLALRIRNIARASKSRFWRKKGR